MPTGIGTGLLLSSIIGGGASLAGGALANKSGQTQTSSSTSTPTLSPEFQSMQDLVKRQITQRLNNNSLPPEYAAGGVRQINNVYDLTKQGLDNTLTARGLGTSPVAGAADTSLALKRAGDVGTFQANLPLVQRQLQGEDLNAAGAFLNANRGTTTTGTGTGTQSSGGGPAGAFTNLAGYLGYLQGKGLFNGGGSVPGTIPGAYQGMPYALPGALTSVGY